MQAQAGGEGEGEAAGGGEVGGVSEGGLGGEEIEERVVPDADARALLDVQPEEPPAPVPGSVYVG